MENLFNSHVKSRLKKKFCLKRAFLFQNCMRIVIDLFPFWLLMKPYKKSLFNFFNNASTKSNPFQVSVTTCRKISLK
jgi:hypothetical protein